MPTISVIIPCHNAAAFVGYTLASLQAQTFTDWEAILIDDGSTDATPEILSSWGERDKRIRLIRQENQGLGKARNVGILDARGQFIHFLDSDDWMLAEAYSNMVMRLLKEPAIAGAYCGMTIATESGIITKEYKRSQDEHYHFRNVSTQKSI